MDRLCARLEGACTGSQLSCLYTLTNISGIGASSVEVQGLNPHGGADENAGDVNPSTPVPSKQSAPPMKEARCPSKKVC